MALILSLETATKAGSVALHKDGNLIGLHFYDIDKSHSKLLHVLITQLLDNASVKPDELDAVALSSGPGSYTGLRIGTSAAKGLCYALSIKLISINTLESMAYRLCSMYNGDVKFCPMIDARRMEVYCAIYTTKMEELEPTKAQIVDENTYDDYLSESQVIFFGDGASKCQTIIKHPNAVFLNKIMPSAEDIGSLAELAYSKGKFEDVAYFEPFYLKEFRIAKPKAQF